MNTIHWDIKHFNDLTKLEFHDIIQLREKVFVVEQDCPYLDVDGQDVHTYHVIGSINKRVVATARIFAPHEAGTVIIGRICNDESTRGSGMGKALVQHALDYCQRQWPSAPIKISAQCYLIRFYNSFGFEIEGEEYLEDGIPHIGMIIR
ncbi:GNAT family N-acetyltransferase [Parvicella tangerina]|uniref:Protein ElaA n=1 Tax=Parvicella tangerina TaxID=2829795 RepID=A0A916JQ39_9FLAO|nr:GNAT family N-acetyltransferase [Parvicella tangerina]CAG5086658.1 Protein ElaA [Parvicella tangerina]